MVLFFGRARGTPSRAVWRGRGSEGLGAAARRTRERRHSRRSYSACRMTAGAEQASQAMLLDLARCSNMYGALFPSGTAGAPEALPPPPPPAAAGAAAGTTLPLDPTTQLLLSGDTAAANLWAAQVGLRGAKRGVEEVLGAPPVSGPTERAKRKKLMRQGQKDLLIQLDSLLHVGDQRSAHKNILEAALGTP